MDKNFIIQITVSSDENALSNTTLTTNIKEINDLAKYGINSDFLIKKCIEQHETNLAPAPLSDDKIHFFELKDYIINLFDRVKYGLITKIDEKEKDELLRYALETIYGRSVIDWLGDKLDNKK